MKKVLNSFIFLSISLILVSCLQNRPTRDCLIEELVLEKSDFPIGSVVEEASLSIAEYPIESAERTASYSQNLIFHLVGRYKSRKGAERKYFKQLERYFEEDDNGKPWVTPTEISYTSPIAQQYHFACGNIGSEYQCRMIGIYEEYYVFFFAYLSEEGITFDILQDLLQKIDYHMANCLQNNY